MSAKSGRYARMCELEKQLGVSDPEREAIDEAVAASMAAVDAAIARGLEAEGLVLPMALLLGRKV